MTLTAKLPPLPGSSHGTMPRGSPPQGSLAMTDDNPVHISLATTVTAGARPGTHPLSLLGQPEPPRGSPHTFALMMVHCRLLLSWSYRRLNSRAPSVATGNTNGSQENVRCLVNPQTFPGHSPMGPASAGYWDHRRERGQAWSYTPSW